jgi:hypothetical protein
MKVSFAKMDWEIMNFPFYSPNLALGDFHSFRPVKVHIGEKFHTNDELMWHLKLAVQSE